MKYRCYFYLLLSTHLNIHISCSSDRRRKKYFRYQMTSLYCGAVSFFWILKVMSVWWFLTFFQLDTSEAPSYFYKPTFLTVFATWLLNGFCWFWYCSHFEMQVQGILLQTLLQSKTKKKMVFSIPTTSFWQVSFFLIFAFFFLFILSFPNKEF